MERIPTAEEMINKHTVSNPKENWERNGKSEITDYNAAMIEFARLHVEAALKAASEGQINKDIYMMLEYGEGMNWKSSILNSYPLENIK